MKYLPIIFLLITSPLVANAEGQNSKFSCTYESIAGATQTVTLEGPQDVDLSNPVGQKTIPLRSNGELAPTSFNVDIKWTKVGRRVTYFYRNPVWISDIVFTYEVDEPARSTSFTGTWTVDHPPVLNMTCEFLNGF